MLKTQYWLCWGKTFHQTRYFEVISAPDKIALGTFLLEKQVVIQQALPYYGYHLLGKLSRKKQLLEWLQGMLLYLEMGYPFIECLNLIQNGIPKSIRKDLVNRAEKGATLSEILKYHPLYFDSHWVEGLSYQDVRRIFKIWASQLEQELNLFSNIQQQLFYPGLLCFLAVLFIVFFNQVLLPQYQTLYQQLNIQTPINAHHYIFYFICLMISFIPFRKHLPWLNTLIKFKEWYRWVSYMQVQTQLDQTFYTSLKSSIPYFQTYHFIGILNQLEHQLRLGYTIQSALPETLPSVLYQTLLHQPNALGFENCIKFFEQNITIYCKKIELIIQPVLLFILSALCGGLMFMIYQPLLKIGQHL